MAILYPFTAYGILQGVQLLFHEFNLVKLLILYLVVRNVSFFFSRIIYWYPFRYSLCFQNLKIFSVRLSLLLFWLHWGSIVLYFFFIFFCLFFHFIFWTLVLLLLIGLLTFICHSVLWPIETIYDFLFCLLKCWSLGI